MFSIKQHDGKPKRKFVERFRQAVVDVEDPNDNIVITAFTIGITPSEQRFYDHVTWDNLQTDAHLFARCEKYLGKGKEYKARHMKEGTAREPKGDKANEVRHETKDDRQRSLVSPQDYVDLKDSRPSHCHIQTCMRK